MELQNCFQRYELKYIITPEKQMNLISALGDTIKHDKFYKSTVMNIYYDTENYRLIRESLEHPLYKEKLRLRSYLVPKDESSPVFVELKKKYDSVVYKRREIMKYSEATDFINNGYRTPLIRKSQIKDEIKYFIDFYNNMRPSVYLSYSRKAYVDANNPNLRITFDSDIVWRDFDINLDSGPYGHPLLDRDLILMEIKVADAMPLYLSRILDKEKIYKTSFSKYGRAYEEMISKHKKGNIVYA